MIKIVYWSHAIFLASFCFFIIYNAYRSWKQYKIKIQKDLYILKLNKKEVKMEKENKDNFISGGYIYDQLDRFAQGLIICTLSEHTYEFTRWSYIKYLKQLCTDDFYIGYNWKFKIGRRYFCKVYAKDSKGVKVASAIFCFIGTEKNYCEMKGK